MYCFACQQDNYINKLKSNNECFLPPYEGHILLCDNAAQVETSIDLNYLVVQNTSD